VGGSFSELRIAYMSDDEVFISVFGTETTGLVSAPKLTPFK
jgi:hypothetical protein